MIGKQAKADMVPRPGRIIRLRYPRFHGSGKQNLMQRSKFSMRGNFKSWQDGARPVPATIAPGVEHYARNCQQAGQNAFRIRLPANPSLLSFLTYLYTRHNPNFGQCCGHTGTESSGA